MGAGPDLRRPMAIDDDNRMERALVHATRAVARLADELARRVGEHHSYAMSVHILRTLPPFGQQVSEELVGLVVSLTVPKGIKAIVIDVRSAIRYARKGDEGRAEVYANRVAVGIGELHQFDR